MPRARSAASNCSWMSSKAPLDMIRTTASRAGRSASAVTTSAAFGYSAAAYPLCRRAATSAAESNRSPSGIFSASNGGTTITSSAVANAAG